MLPITTNQETTRSITEIPSRTYKLNINEDTSSSYVLDDKNIVKFKIAEINNSCIEKTAHNFSYFPTNITLNRNYKIELDFSITYTPMDYSIGLARRVIFGFYKLSGRHERSFQICTRGTGYFSPFDLSTLYLYINGEQTIIQQPYHDGVRHKVTIDLYNNKILLDDVVVVNSFNSDELDTTQKIQVFGGSYYSEDTAYGKIYSVKITDAVNNSDIIDWKPSSFQNELEEEIPCFYDAVTRSNILPTYTDGLTYIKEIKKTNLFAYPQNPDCEVNFAIENGHLIGTSNNTEALQKYSRKDYNVYFTSTAFGDRLLGHVDKLQAIKQTVYHILMTERYAYLIYSNNYGVEFEQYIGKDFNYLKATIETTLREALTYDLRIKDIEIIDLSKDGDKANIKFNVYSIYGDLQMEVSISV